MDQPANSPHPPKPKPVEVLEDKDLDTATGAGDLFRISHPKGAPQALK